MSSVFAVAMRILKDIGFYNPQILDALEYHISHLYVHPDGNREILFSIVGEIDKH